jgi:ParB family chromosome partitioning protein
MANKNKEQPVLKNLDDLFNRIKEQSAYKYKVTSLPIDDLVAFNKHPFRLYEDKRLDDMIESIKENGIIAPIIVRPANNQKYEILSGHNRVKAAKVLELEVVPAVIREDLSDEDALLVVTETNLIQRSFADLAHSERAAALSTRHEVIKNQGKRTDLINEIEMLLKNGEKLGNSTIFETSDQVGQKLSSRSKTAQDYGLGGTSVARYLRINKLIDSLKKHLDNGDFGIVAGVEISYLSDEEQENLNMTLESLPHKLDIKKAELLRVCSKEKKLTCKMIEDILSGSVLRDRSRASLPVQAFKIKGKLLSKYFKPEDKPEDIEAEIIEALEFYRAHKDSRL